MLGIGDRVCAEKLAANNRTPRGWRDCAGLIEMIDNHQISAAYASGVLCGRTTQIARRVVEMKHCKISAKELDNLEPKEVVILLLGLQDIANNTKVSLDRIIEMLGPILLMIEHSIFRRPATDLITLAAKVAIICPIIEAERSDEFYLMEEIEQILAV